METIKTNRIISAFQNEIDSEKLAEYTEIFQNEMLSHSFPAISGFPGRISESDIERNLRFLTGEKVDYEHLNQLVWFVTDGHHRSLAAIEANLPFLEVERDVSTITDEKQLTLYRQENLRHLAIL